MKTKLLALSAACAAFAASAIPQAPVITYGLVRDPYGTPLTKASSATLELVRNAARDGTVYARASVGDSGIPGMNYRLSLEIDSSGPTRANAVCAGTEMFVAAALGGNAATLSPTAVFTTPSLSVPTTTRTATA